MKKLSLKLFGHRNSESELPVIRVTLNDEVISEFLTIDTEGEKTYLIDFDVAINNDGANTLSLVCLNYFENTEEVWIRLQNGGYQVNVDNCKTAILVEAKIVDEINNREKYIFPQNPPPYYGFFVDGDQITHCVHSGYEAFSKKVGDYYLGRIILDDDTPIVFAGTTGTVFGGIYFSTYDELMNNTNQFVIGHILKNEEKIYVPEDKLLKCEGELWFGTLSKRSL